MRIDSICPGNLSKKRKKHTQNTHTHTDKKTQEKHTPKNNSNTKNENLKIGKKRDGKGLINLRLA